MPRHRLNFPKRYSKLRDSAACEKCGYVFKSDKEKKRYIDGANVAITYSAWILCSSCAEKEKKNGLYY